MKKDIASSRPKDFTWYADGDGEEYVVHSKEFPEYRFRVSSGNEKRDKSLACYAVNAVNNFGALLDASQSAYAVLSTLRIILKPEAWDIVEPIKEKLETAIANAEK